MSRWPKAARVCGLVSCRTAPKLATEYFQGTPVGWVLKAFTKILNYLPRRPFLGRTEPDPTSPQKYSHISGEDEPNAARDG